jgi:hypothetical protein
MDMEETYPIHHHFAAHMPVLHLLIAAMQLVAHRLDDVPMVRHSGLVPDHVDGSVVTKILPLIELIIDAFVVLANGLIGASAGGRSSPDFTRR